MVTRIDRLVGILLWGFVMVARVVRLCPLAVAVVLYVVASKLRWCSGRFLAGCSGVMHAC